MKLLLDQHLSRSLVPVLDPLFPGTSHVGLHGLDRSDDLTVWEFALANGFAIATKDEDFQILSFARGHPPKVVWLRSGNGPSKQIKDLFERSRPILEQFATDPDQSLLVLP